MARARSAQSSTFRSKQHNRTVDLVVPLPAICAVAGLTSDYVDVLHVCTIESRDSRHVHPRSIKHISTAADSCPPAAALWSHLLHARPASSPLLLFDVFPTFCCNPSPPTGLRTISRRFQLHCCALEWTLTERECRCSYVFDFGVSERSAAAVLLHCSRTAVQKCCGPDKPGREWMPGWHQLCYVMPCCVVR